MSKWGQLGEHWHAVDEQQLGALELACGRVLPTGTHLRETFSGGRYCEACATRQWQLATAAAISNRNEPGPTSEGSAHRRMTLSVLLNVLTYRVVSIPPWPRQARRRVTRTRTLTRDAAAAGSRASGGRFSLAANLIPTRRRIGEDAAESPADQLSRPDNDFAPGRPGPL